MHLKKSKYSLHLVQVLSHTHTHTQHFIFQSDTSRVRENANKFFLPASQILSPLEICSRKILITGKDLKNIVYHYTH